MPSNPSLENRKPADQPASEFDSAHVNQSYEDYCADGYCL